MNCETDIPECEAEPCENGGSCYEKSIVSYYQNTNELPEELRPYFEEPFSFDDAEGYLCKCSAGYEGKLTI